MYFGYIKIFNTDYKEEIILALESAGISRASYVESQDLEKELANEISLFRGFFDPDRSKGVRGLIFALLEEKSQVREMLSSLEAAGIPIRTEEVLRVLVWPVEGGFDSVLGEFGEL